MKIGVDPSLNGLNDRLVVADPADGTGDCGPGAFDVEAGERFGAELFGFDLRWVEFGAAVNDVEAWVRR